MVRLTGAFVVVLSLMAAILGGYCLNAETVTTSATDYTYITDVSGAFDGSKADIVTDYNPSSNLTGYSVFQPGTQGVDSVPGISYKEANPNSYYIQTASGTAKNLSVTLTSNKASAASGAGYATLTYSGTVSASGDRPIIEGPWGQYNAEIRTQMDVGGQLHYAPVGITLDSYLNALKSIYKSSSGSDLPSGKIYISFPGGDAAGYPGFVADQSFDYQTTRPTGTISVGYSAVSPNIVVDQQAHNVEMNGAVYNTSQIRIVWGGTTDLTSRDLATTAEMALVVGADTVTSYVDPRAGVTAIPVTSTVSEIVREVSDSTDAYGFFSYPKYSSSERIVYQTVTMNGQFVFSVNILIASNGYYIIGIFDKDIEPTRPVGGIQTYEGNIQSNQNINVFWKWSGTSSISFAVTATTGTPTAYPSSYSDVYDLKAPATLQTVSAGFWTNVSDRLMSDNRPNVTEIYDGTHSTKSSVNNSATTLNTSQVTTKVVETTTEYTTTYWSNGYKNASLSVLFKAPTSATTSQWVFSDEKGTTYTYTISASVVGSRTDWTVDGSDLGQYPAMVLTWTVSDGKVTLFAQRVSSFSDFLNYKTMGEPVPVSSKSFDGKYIASFALDSSAPQFLHEVVDTKVIIENGGEYIVDGVFRPMDKFPEVRNWSFKIVSVAHPGDSMTVTPTEESR